MCLCIPIRITLLIAVIVCAASGENFDETNDQEIISFQFFYLFFVFKK